MEIAIYVDMRIYNWKNSLIKILENFSEKNIKVIGNDIFTLEIIETLIYLDYNVSGIYTNSEETFSNLNIKVYQLDDLPVNKIGDSTFFVVAELIGHREAYEKLISKGYRLEKNFNILGIGGYTELLTAIDPILTLNRNEKFPGFKIYSNCNNCAWRGIRIVILGNSTSDSSTGNIKSWVEKLYEKLNDVDIKITIWNGAVTGYSSTQEFLKLNRDVLNLDPDIVISFSGYNDIIENATVTGFPFLHKYQDKFYRFLQNQERLAPDSMFVRNVNCVVNGMRDSRSDYEIWIDNMRKMKAVCCEFNVKFVAYLQPMVGDAKAVMSSESQKIIDAFIEVTNANLLLENVKKFCNSARNNIQQFNYIHDLTGIFYLKENVFYDTCHYTDYGNDIISTYVFNDIIKILK